MRGLRTVIYHVKDLPLARTWYAELLKQDPYFDQPFYVGFSVGGFELGLVPDGSSGPGGTVAYWGVSAITEAVDRLLKLGATVREPIEDVGGGIKVATVNDPFGNILGVIQNPRFATASVK